MATIAKQRRTRARGAVLELVEQRPGITIPQLLDALAPVDTHDVLLRALIDADVAVTAPLGRLLAALSLPERSRDEITAALASTELAVTAHTPAVLADPLADAWGPEPTDDELAEARRAGEGAVQAALNAALDGALSRDAAAARIGVTPQAVSERRKAGKLVALRRGREWRFPAWQFADDGTLPALDELIDAYPGTPLALSTWAVTPARDLDGLTPAQALGRRGGSERVLELAHALRGAAW